MVTGYSGWRLQMPPDKVGIASPDGTIVAIEESLRGEFAEGMPDVLARVDPAVQHDRAIADYTDAIRIEPDDVGTYLMRGEACRKLGDKTKSEHAIRPSRHDARARHPTAALLAAIVVSARSGPGRIRALAVGDLKLAMTFTGTTPVSALLGRALINPIK